MNPLNSHNQTNMVKPLKKIKYFTIKQNFEI